MFLSIRGRGVASDCPSRKQGARRFVSVAAALLGLAVAAGCGPRASFGGGTCAAAVFSGDLAISEVMADPAGADAGHEWIEFYNATTAPLNLAGIRVTVAATDGTDAKSMLLGTTATTIGARAYYVVATTEPTALPAWVDLGVGTALGALRNGGGRITLSCGATIVDTVTYGAAPPGASLAFDGVLAPDAIANDDPARWCPGTAEYAPGAHGSPGGRNPACAANVAVTRECTGADGMQRAAVAPKPGQLVISEVLADPKAAADADGEYMELLALADVDLNGMALGRAVDDIAQVLVAERCLEVASGQRVLMARSADPTTNGNLPPVDVELTLALANGGGSIVIAFGADVIDAVTYPSATAGVAWSLDPSNETSAANDLTDNWCAARSVFGAGDLGTPKAANDACPITLAAGQCLEGGRVRAIRTPAPGAVVITEFMANPAQIADNVGEWIEIRALADFDLNGLELGRVDPQSNQNPVETTIAQVDCTPVTVGSHVLLARHGDPAVNGGLPPPQALFGFALNNSERGIWVGHGGRSLDQVAYASTSDGAARALDPDAVDAVANDDPAHWCDAQAVYGSAGNRGTPAAANHACAACWDGHTWRLPVAPQPGDLVLSEFMPDSAAVADTKGEWLEVFARRAVDLNGLELSRLGAASSTIASTTCVAVAAGEFAVFARSASAAVNGGLTDVTATFSFGLPNTPPQTVQVAHGGRMLDQATYTTVSPGRALMLAIDRLDVQTNDDAAAWCTALLPYGAGDFGTPGTADVCP